jgi:acetolactate synthase-1/2/3 large subunit
MTGAESLLLTLLAGGIEVCFTGPGTAEIQRIAAFDRLRNIRCVPGLSERVATGAADGYARMVARPAATLLHLRAELAENTAHLHSAGQARVPIVNLIADEPRENHRSDLVPNITIEAIARACSGWFHISERSRHLGRDVAEAILAARMAPGRVATLGVSAEAATGEDGRAAAVFNPPQAPMPDSRVISRVACLLGRQAPAGIVLGGEALYGHGLVTAGRLAAATGAKLLMPRSSSRVEGGAGITAVEFIPPAMDPPGRSFSPFRLIILAGAAEEDVGFARPTGPDIARHASPTVATLAAPEQDAVGALEALAVALSAHVTTPRGELAKRPLLPSGPITPSGVAAVIGALLPERAIVADDSQGLGREILQRCRGASPHDWMISPGGSLGLGIPLAVGAATACPDRSVLCLSAGTASMATMQGLWTIAQEGLPITALVFATCRERMADRRTGAPALDRLGFAGEMGVRGRRVETLEALADAVRAGFASDGPSLIEVPL